MSLPAPYYQDEAVTIYHGDCREILPLLPPVDLVLTDPPFGVALNTDNRRFSGGHTAARHGNGVGSYGGRPITGDDEPFDPRHLLNYGEHQVIWGWNNFPDRLPAGACLAWIKRNDEAFGSFLSDAELAWMSKGRGVYCFRDLSNNAIARERLHPTQKPLPLMKWCLGFFPKARHVLDPYMGSGSTLRAAKDLGLHAIGIEIEEENCEKAARRMAQSVLPLEA